MSPEIAFQVASTLVLPQWLLMAVAPRWNVTRWLMNSYLIPVCIAVIYLVYLFSDGAIDFGAFGSLAGIKRLFATGSSGVILAAWVHYLAFDLVVGSVIVRDAQAKNIPHWLIVLPLFFCFMLGPVGLLLYWIVRLIRTRRLSI
ncbi:ABA4-like family protein [Spirosoma panaciterrae]|uniref:ABA4-like family protein n=1 Tax=Spirosoma panaciterrae TaxID=496058 RepID=UPI0003603EF2|nr:ABA4-like family protein [Spirosoma panaciterrae]